MNHHTVSQLIQDLHQKKCSSLEITHEFINKINNYKDLNALISTDTEQALIEAEIADKKIQKGQAKALTGIPMAVKDLFCTTSMPTTCGSKMLAHYTSPYEAHIVSQLKQAGSFLLAKTNMDEFGMGSANENSYFGPVKNPWDKTRVSGGSSGGSAVAVAAGLIPFAIGSDTGGSIRQPAALCGISGIKPTYGLASRFGMVAICFKFGSTRANGALS